jgi:hypothetical protein
MDFKKILLKLDVSNLINCIHNIGYIIELPRINKKILSPIPVIQDKEDKMGGNIRYFFRKTNIINVNLHGNMEKINESDILLFFNKSSKNDNDSSNKIREKNNKSMNYFISYSFGMVSLCYNIVPTPSI